MLTTLHIANYALIDDIELSPGESLNIITGETGAGKSIILSALGLLMGGRADSQVVTDKARKSVVEASFSLADADTEALQAVFAEADLDWDPDTLILRREIAPSTGRSRAFVNDTPASLDTLQRIGRHLVDIHSQHQSQLLADAAYQLHVIDTLADNGTRLGEYSVAYQAYLYARRKMQTLREEAERVQADAEYMRAEHSQIADLRLTPGEQLALEKEQRQLAHAADTAIALSEAAGLLDGDEAGALTLLKRANSLLDGVDASAALGQLAARLTQARAEIVDIAQEVSAALQRSASDPSRLEAVDQRLADIYTLCRRHKVADSDGLMALQEQLRQRLDLADNSREAIEEAHTQAKEAHQKSLAIARDISQRRHEAASALADQWLIEASPLGMPHLQCSITLTPLRQLSPSGIDHAEMLFAFNRGQQPMAIGRTASGGEVSRLMLALKAVIARRMRIPTIIFDEVDTGVSGEIAIRMGRMMADIASQGTQVVAITHLPQVAALGRTHFKVYKEDTLLGTNTRLRPLGKAERVSELAIMLAGTPDEPHARATAQALLANK